MDPQLRVTYSTNLCKGKNSENPGCKLTWTLESKTDKTATDKLDFEMLECIDTADAMEELELDNSDRQSMDRNGPNTEDY